MSGREVAVTHGDRGSILLIDDLSSPRRPCAEWLEREGWTLCECTWTQLSSRLSEVRPDVVLWPDPRALEEGASCEVPIVAILDAPLPDGGRALVTAGFFDVVVVDDDPVPLLLALERARRHGTVCRENERLKRELSRATQVLRSQLVELQRQARRQAMVEDALTIARDHALAASRAKSAFLTNMSHELRTPLNAMLGYAELMSETIDDPRIIGDLGRIIFAGHHLLSLIDDVLDLAKVEAGHATLEVSDLDVLALVEAVRLQALPTVEQRGLSFVVEQGPGPLEGFRSDPRLLLQCLHQLVDNAVKFTEHGTVTVRLARVDDELHIAVSDTGRGIPPRDQARIFGAFHNLEDSPPSGPGLGLTITQRLCDLVGAKLVLSSEVGAGSTFTIQLPPAARPVEASSGDDEPAPASGTW